MTLLQTLEEKRVLFADTGVDSWNSATVARQILARIAESETVAINKFDLETLHRMGRVLQIAVAITNPFQSLAIDLHSIEMDSSMILAQFGMGAHGHP